MEALSRLSQEDVKALMSEPRPLHRFADTMSGVFHSAVRRIADVYAGDASRIWAGAPPSADVVYRFLEFDGVGPKIATMAVNILAREFKVPLAEHYSVDIAADVHVRRVFGRLHLCPPGATVEQIVYRARALSPLFPGMLDFPCWEIGKKWCRAERPLCGGCFMNDLCPTANPKSRDTAASPAERVG
jgi:endonuclease III